MQNAGFILFYELLEVSTSHNKMKLAKSFKRHLFAKVIAFPVQEEIF